jgi:hypothetical protein
MRPHREYNIHMVYSGKVEHGMVVLDDPQALPEGAKVEVTLIEPPLATRVGEGLERLAGLAQDLPADLSENHDRYRRERPS